MIRIIVLAAVAICLTEAYPYGYGYGYGRSHNGYESDVNRANAVRQLRVNDIANHVGSGTGTAYKDGVAGTPLGVTGRDRYAYGHGYGYGGYGHGYDGYYGNRYGHYGGYGYQ